MFRRIHIVAKEISPRGQESCIVLYCIVLYCTLRLLSSDVILFLRTDMTHEVERASKISFFSHVFFLLLPCKTLTLLFLLTEAIRIQNFKHTAGPGSV